MSGHEHSSRPAGDATPATPHGGAGARSVTDPVCGMQVDPQRTPHHAAHAGQAYHFCTARCCERFIADPEKLLASAGTDADVVAPADTVYTCPMHPQIRQQAP